MVASGGMYRMAKCARKEAAIAPTRYMFLCGGTTSSEQSSDSAFSEFNISIVTSTVSDSVDATTLPFSK